MPGDNTKVQLAIQGGGAKLFALVAAADAIAALKGDNGSGFELSRVAGTSAGAIVAAALAADVAPSTLRARLTSISINQVAGKRFSSWPLKYWQRIRAGLRLLLNIPLANMEPIRAALSDVIGEALGVDDGLKVKFKDLTIPCFVIAADVSRADGIELGGLESDEFVVDAVLDSCAIPFFFRLPAENQNPRMDGGISTSLATRTLLREESD